MIDAATAAPRDLRGSLVHALAKAGDRMEAALLQQIAVEVFRVLHEAGLRVDMVELARFAEDDHDRSRDLFAGSNGLGTWATRERPMMSWETHLSLC